MNPAYHEVLKQHGLVFSGLSPDGRLVEIIELPDHPFFMAGQFHPELRSRPTRPHPLFRDFVGAAAGRRARGRAGAPPGRRPGLSRGPTEPAATPRGVLRAAFLTVDVEAWPGIGRHEVVRHPGAAAVLPVTPTGDVLLVRQFRPAVRQALTEIPAGLLDVEGEDALTCASRELFEETGYRHETIEFLGGYYSSAGFTDEYVHLFWRGTTAGADARRRRIEVVRRPLDEMVAAARAGRSATRRPRSRCCWRGRARPGPPARARSGRLPGAAAREHGGRA